MGSTSITVKLSYDMSIGVEAEAGSEKDKFNSKTKIKLIKIFEFLHIVSPLILNLSIN